MRLLSALFLLSGLVLAVIAQEPKAAEVSTKDIKPEERHKIETVEIQGGVDNEPKHATHHVVHQGSAAKPIAGKIGVTTGEHAGAHGQAGAHGKAGGHGKVTAHGQVNGHGQGAGHVAGKKPCTKGQHEHGAVHSLPVHHGQQVQHKQHNAEVTVETWTQFVKKYTEKITQFVTQKNWNALAQWLFTVSKQPDFPVKPCSKGGVQTGGSSSRYIVIRLQGVGQDDLQRVVQLNQKSKTGSDGWWDLLVRLGLKGQPKPKQDEAVKVILTIINQHQNEIRDHIKKGDWQFVIDLLNKNSQSKNIKIDWNQVLGPKNPNGDALKKILVHWSKVPQDQAAKLSLSQWLKPEKKTVETTIQHPNHPGGTTHKPGQKPTPGHVKPGQHPTPRPGVHVVTQKGQVPTGPHGPKPTPGHGKPGPHPTPRPGTAVTKKGQVATEPHGPHPHPTPGHGKPGPHPTPRPGVHVTKKGQVVTGPHGPKPTPGHVKPGQHPTPRPGVHVTKKGQQSNGPHGKPTPGHPHPGVTPKPGQHPTPGHPHGGVVGRVTTKPGHPVKPGKQVTPGIKLPGGVTKKNEHHVTPKPGQKPTGKPNHPGGPHGTVGHVTKPHGVATPKPQPGGPVRNHPGKPVTPSHPVKLPGGAVTKKHGVTPKPGQKPTPGHSGGVHIGVTTRPGQKVTPGHGKPGPQPHPRPHPKPQEQKKKTIETVVKQTGTSEQDLDKAVQLNKQGKSGADGWFYLITQQAGGQKSPETTKKITTIVDQNQDQIKQKVKSGDWQGLIILLTEQSEQQGVKIDWNQVLGDSKNSAFWKMILLKWASTPEQQAKTLDLDSWVTGDSDLAANRANSIILIIQENQEEVQKLVQSGDKKKLQAFLEQKAQEKGIKADWKDLDLSNPSSEGGQWFKIIQSSADQSPQELSQDGFYQLIAKLFGNGQALGSLSDLTNGFTSGFFQNIGGGSGSGGLSSLFGSLGLGGESGGLLGRLGLGGSGGGSQHSGSGKNGGYSWSWSSSDGQSGSGSSDDESSSGGLLGGLGSNLGLGGGSGGQGGSGGLLGGLGLGR